VSVSQIGDTPRVRVQWVRTTGSDEGWMIDVDGEVVERLELDEVETDGDIHSYVLDTLRPFIGHTVGVRAIDGGKRTVATTDYIETEVKSVWLLGAGEGNDVCFRGDDLSGLDIEDKRVTSSPVNLGYDIDAVTAFADGPTGGYGGELDDLGGDIYEQAARLEAMRQDSTTLVRLVYATTNVPVSLRKAVTLESPVTRAGRVVYDALIRVQTVGD
jgi:hypothetical protein